MTAVERRPRLGATSGGRPDGAGPRRARHHLVAALALLVLGLVAGSDGFWSADEAVAHAQVDLLRDGRWTEPFPTPSLDDDGRWFPISGVHLGQGVAGPYVKHPLLPAVAAVGDVVAGPVGRFAVPAAGALLAAGLLAGVVERRRPGRWVGTYWLVLAGTPLWFHASLFWAHTWGVVAGAMITRAVVELVDRPGREPSWRDHGLLALGVAVGVATRSEVVLFALATVAVLGLAALAWRHRHLAVTAVVVAGSTAAAFVADGWWRRRALGTDVGASLPTAADGRFDVEVRAFLVQLWTVGGEPGPVPAARLLGVLALAGVVLYLIRRPATGRGPVALVAVAALVAFVTGTTAGATTSLFAATPVLLAGLVAAFVPPSGRSVVDRPAGSRPTEYVLVAIAVVHVGLVVFTSYRDGGGGDWGGRYLAVALAPLLVVAVTALGDRGFLPGSAQPEAVAARPVVVALVAMSMVTGLAISLDVVDHRRRSAELRADLVAELATIEAVVADRHPGDDRDPVVVITDARIARLVGPLATTIEGPTFTALHVPEDDLELAFDVLDGEIVLLLDLLAPVADADLDGRERTPIGEHVDLLVD